MAEHYDYSKPIEFQPEGGSAQVTFALTCSSEVTLKQPTPSWITIPPYDQWNIEPYGEGGIKGQFVMSVGASEQGHEATTLTFVIDGTDECNEKKLIVLQNGIDCSCNNLVITDVLSSIPSDGLGIDTVLAKYSVLDDCVETDYTATLIEGSSQYTVTLSNGDVLLKTEIPEIDRDSDVKTFVLQFKYNGSNCPLLRFEILQESIPCTCDSIDYFVVSLKRTFPVSGSGDNYVIIATGDTHGCGYLSAITTSQMIETGEIIIEETGEYSCAFKCKILAYTGANRYRTADVRLFFRKKDETEFRDCDRIITLVQSDDYCDCTIGKMRTINYDGIDCQEYTGYRSLEVAASICATISAKTENDWITINPFSDKRQTVNIAKNTTGEDRTGYVHVTSIIDVDPDHPSGIVCENVDVKIVQKACDLCTCDNLNPRLYYNSCEEIEYNETGETIVDLFIFDSGCEGRLYTKEMEEQGIEPELGDYRIVFCEWKEGDDHSWINGDPYFKDQYIYVDVASENSGYIDRTVNFKVAIQYYREGFTPGDYIWYGGCGDSDCAENVCLTQKYNFCKDCSKLQKDFYINTQIDCTKHNDYIIGSNSAKEVCGYYFSGYTCDAEGTPSSYTWVTITNSPTPLTHDILYADFEENLDDEPRTAYIYSYLTDEYGTPIDFGNPPDPEDPDICGYLIPITQPTCSTVCDCNSYYLNVQTSGYQDEFTDGDGPGQKVAKIYKNNAPCLNVYPNTTQPTYIDVALQSLDENYDEVVVNVKDNSITTMVAVSIDIYVFNDESQRTCTTSTIHIKINPKT